jgi:hypothetical protein
MSVDAWEDLAARLALVFTHMEADDFLILSSGPYYVQCYRDPDLLCAEALADRPGFPPVPIGAEGGQRLRDLGWLPPQETWGNWTVELDCPYSSRAARRLADRMVASLREVYQAEDPGDLRYKASNSQTGEPWDVGSLGLIPATAS